MVEMAGKRSESVLIIFSKNAQKGKVKTRLASTLGESAAFRVFQIMLQRIRKAVSELSIDKAVFFSDYIDNSEEWCSSSFRKFVQKGEDIGNRMGQAFSVMFNQGYKHVCLIGTDCYALQPQIIHKTFELLQTHSLVLGPANDGGYYLIALSGPAPWLFEGVNWSTPHVLAQTIQHATRFGQKYALVDELVDIDTESDLKKAAPLLWQQIKQNG